MPNWRRAPLQRVLEMTLTDKDREELTAEFQRKVGAMVDREVVYCVSNLMSVVLPGLYENSDYIDEAMALLYGRTYWVPWRPATGEHRSEEGDEFDSEDDAQEWIDGQEKDWEIEERTDEVFEHWIVTRWLKERLQEKGQIVEDIHGVDVWARCCTGQAIHLDHYMCDIYREFSQP